MDIFTGTELVPAIAAVGGILGTAALVWAGAKIFNMVKRPTS